MGKRDLKASRKEFEDHRESDTPENLPPGRFTGKERKTRVNERAMDGNEREGERERGGGGYDFARWRVIAQQNLIYFVTPKLVTD